MSEGTYVGVRFSDASMDALEALQQRLQVPNPTPREKFHLTLVYSRQPIEWKADEHLDETALPVGWETWEQRDGNHALVLLVSNEHLTARHIEARLRGATWDHDEYRPHITLSYDIGEAFSADDLSVPDLELKITEEYVKPLDIGWSERS